MCARGLSMDGRPSAARPRLIVPRNATSATGEPTCHSNRLTHGGRPCVLTVGGGAAPVGIAQGQNAIVACGTWRQSAIVAVASCAPAPTMRSAPSLACAIGSNMSAVCSFRRPNIQRTESSLASGDRISAWMSMPFEGASNPCARIQSTNPEGTENVATCPRARSATPRASIGWMSPRVPWGASSTRMSVCILSQVWPNITL